MFSNYTNSIQKNPNITLEDFLWQFLNIHLKDDNAEGLIKYYKKKIKSTKIKLSKFKKLSDAQIQNKIDKQFKISIKEQKDFISEIENQKNSIKRLFVKVTNWNCPSNEFKQFILRELDDIKLPKPRSICEFKKESIEEFKSNEFYLLNETLINAEKELNKILENRKMFADIKRSIQSQDKALEK